VQRIRKSGEVLDELPEVRRQTEERSYLTDTLRCGPRLDHRDLPRIDPDALCANDVTEKMRFWLRKTALAELSVQLMLSKQFQDLLQVLRMLGRVFGEDENIIHIDHG
jgi:hypothetical protein